MPVACCQRPTLTDESMPGVRVDASDKWRNRSEKSKAADVRPAATFEMFLCDVGLWLLSATLGRLRHSFAKVDWAWSLRSGDFAALRRFVKGRRDDTTRARPRPFAIDHLPKDMRRITRQPARSPRRRAASTLRVRLPRLN